MTDDTRHRWSGLAEQLARPVLAAAADGRWPAHCTGTAPIEAICRTLAGLAPWLVRQAPGDLRELLARAMRSDAIRFDQKRQSLVEAAFFSHAMLRAPELWRSLDGELQRSLLDRLRASRQWEPAPNNWLLFSAAVEAFFKSVGEDHLQQPIDTAVARHVERHLGDGVYGDGPHFRADYYNSFVMHPMMLAVLRAVGDEPRHAEALRLAHRAAAILERMVSPEGAYPPVGRSLAYRIGAFQLLAQLALDHQLPSDLPPAQVRCALDAVVQRSMSAPGTFDPDGWLTVGFHGEQPAIGEGYINRGSVYLCCAGLLPLGLSERDPYWADPPRDWTSKRIYAGQDTLADHALE